MITYPKISIVTPSYNQGQFLEETILSVINQNYPNLEFIIIDGGSTDNSVQIIKKYENHLSYWVSEADNGQADAINKGFVRCTGEIFNWLNSDDYLVEGALFKIAKAFVSDKIEVACFRENRVNELGEFVRKSEGTTILDTHLETFARFHIDQPSTYFRRDSLMSIFPLNTKCHYLMDAEFWLRYLVGKSLDNIFKSEEAVVNFRLHDQSKTVASQEYFQIEKNSLENGVIRSLKVENKIAKLLLSRPVSFNYHFPGNVQDLDQATLLSYYSARSIELFYLKRDYGAARILVAFVAEHKPELLQTNSVIQTIIKHLKWPNLVLQLIHAVR